MQANGQVWIINANGILFGQGSQINVSGLLATTSDIADSDFAAGRYDFNSPTTNPTASVDNAGTIHVPNGGSAVLSAPHVTNSGLIQADAGQIVLGGANAFTVDFDGDNLIRYAITAPVSNTPTDTNGVAQNELVANSGTLSAAGGKILLTARAAANVADNVVNNTGMISATSASVQNGEVVLDAGDGTVQAGGTIDATGNGAGQTGGNVTLAGNTVNVADNAVIDASGDQGGGNISIGGGLHGSGPYAPAQSTTVANATIHADAHTSGNGGTVSIWSSGSTQFSGTVTATGGSQSGNGGLVETSGQTLGVASGAVINTSASAGMAGNWLLDPLNLTVGASGNTLPGGIISYASPTSTVGAATVQNALLNTNVTLQAVDDIFINSAIDGSGTGHSLTFDAGRSIFVNANITMTGNGGTLTLSANNPAANRLDPGAPIIYGAGVLSADFINIQLPAKVSDGSSVGSPGSPVLVGAGQLSIQTNGANAYIQSANAATGLLLGTVNVGTFQATSSGNLTIASGGSITSSASGDAVVLSATQNFINNSGSGAMTLTGGGRFLIFSAAPAGDTFGGLDSGNTAIWNKTDPASISASGNRYIFALQPTLTFTSTDQSKTYGVDSSGTIGSAYSISGLQTGVAGAFLGDSSAGAFTGTPGVTSLGTAAGAGVAGGPYQITVSKGSLVSSLGYAFAFVSSGRLTVDPALLSVTANPLSKVYGSTDPALTFVSSGFVNGDSAALLTGSLTRASGGERRQLRHQPGHAVGRD